MDEGVIPKIINDGDFYTPGRFSLRDLERAIVEASIPQSPPPILMTLNSKQQFDVFFEYGMLDKRTRPKLHFISWPQRRRLDFIEFKLYSKGSLWTIRRYGFNDGYYTVYYGTLKRAYCTTLNDCISFINSIETPPENHPSTHDYF